MIEKKYRLIKGGKIVGYERWNSLAGKWCYDIQPDGRFFIENVFIPHTDKDTFTGLKDKNGKEIYEGDIIKIGKGTYVCEYQVTEWSGEFRFMVLPHKKWFDGSNHPKEVIGNIHSTPELLEEQKK